MVKRTVESGCPVGHCAKKRRQVDVEGNKPHAAAPPTDVAAVRSVHDFLEAIIPGTPGVLRDATNCQSLAQVPVHAWWAFAELNALLQQHQHMMEEVTLRSYHSFTREAKAVVLQRVIAADPAVTSRRAAGHSGSCAPFACPAAMQPLQPAQLPLHLQMAMHILDRSFRAFSDCSVVRYTFADRPAWLAQWCARWNLGVSDDMSLLAINAHAAAFDCIHVGTGEPYLNPTNPVATVYVPIATQ